MISVIYYPFVLIAQEDKISMLKIEGGGEEKICPVKYKQGIVFMSSARTNLLKTVRDETGQIPYNLFYQKVFNELVVGGDAVIFSENLVTEFNDGPVCFAKNEELIFYTRNTDINDVSNSKRNRTLGIFISTKGKGERWHQSSSFEHNRPDYNLIHPATNSDGTILVFSSNMPGGNGGYDLYISLQDHLGHWSKPRNLGSTVNTQGNEVFPSFFKDEWLLFSSDGRDGQGGLDIYRSKWEEDLFRYSASTPLDSSINSKFDDFGISLNEDGLSGYFGSDRNGSEQIYFFKQSLPKLEDCVEEKPLNLCYYIEENSIVSDSDHPLKFVWDLGDGTKKDGLEVYHCYPRVGKYVAALQIIDTISNEIYYSVSELEINIELDDRPYIIGPDSVHINDYASFSADMSGLKKEVREIFWDFEDGSVQMQENVNRYFGLIGQQNVKLAIVGSDGSVQCVNKKIEVVDKNTVISKYKVLTHQKKVIPVAESKLGYAVQLLQSFKQEVLSDSILLKVNYPITQRFNEVDSIYQYTVGESDKVASLYHLYKEMRDLGFDSKLISFELNYDNGIDAKEVLIFFSPGKDEITAYNEANLNDFSRKLNSFSKLEVLGYADPSGSVKSNKKLSYRRAINVAKYLEKCGISEDNIEVDAIGEVRTSSTETEMLRYYRKVEVRLIDN
ncbi:PKD domain-containing protein [Flavobacteriales bacterium]|nr:PKD domain-containing protein [Flavobacteriales bacterium]